MSKDVTTNRRNLVLLIAAFVLPVVLAKLALNYQWFDYGVTNQGALLTKPKTLNELGVSIEQDKQWLLLTVLPNGCDERCEYTLKGIENTYLALGRETHRVTPVAVGQPKLSEQQSKLFNANHWQFKADTTSHQLASDSVYIIDPLGNVVLTYSKPINEQSIPAFGKAILSDLKKVLKLSRIG